MFRHVGGTWRLVKVQRGTFLFPFIVVDNDIQENAPAFRRGDPRCLPSGGRQGRIWHWNGKRLVPAAAGWMLLTLGGPGSGGGDLYSPLPGRIYCSVKDGDEDEFYVYCGSETLGQTVRLELSGQTSICASNQIAEPPWNLRPARLPIGLNITFERFRCASQQTGVLCTVIGSGKGFLINSTGITRVG